MEESHLRGTEKAGKKDHSQPEMWQGLRPGFLLWAFCGTTKVMPCYKTRFEEVFAEV